MKSHKRFAFGAIALATVVGIAAATPAKASFLLDYTTSGTFDITSPSPMIGNHGSTVLWGNGLEILSFSGTTQAGLSVPDPAAPLGTFWAFGGSFTDLSQLTGSFSLTLTETSPANASHTFPSTIMGSLAFDSGGHLTIGFTSPTSFTVGNVNYALPSSIKLDAPDCSHLYTSATLTANITDPPPISVPEPSALVVMASGLVPLGFWGLHRLNANRARLTR
jgi:hypothetical protein